MEHIIIHKLSFRLEFENLIAKSHFNKLYIKLYCWGVPNGRIVGLAFRARLTLKPEVNYAMFYNSLESFAFGKVTGISNVRNMAGNDAYVLITKKGTIFLPYTIETIIHTYKLVQKIPQLHVWRYFLFINDHFDMQRTLTQWIRTSGYKWNNSKLQKPLLLEIKKKIII